MSSSTGLPSGTVVSSNNLNEATESEDRPAFNDVSTPSSRDTTDTAIDFTKLEPAGQDPDHQSGKSSPADLPPIHKPNRFMPDYFLFTRYLDRETGTLYALGLTGALLAGLAFPSLDLLYGDFTAANTSGSSQFTAAEAEEAQAQARIVGLGILGVGIGELLFTWMFLYCFTRAGEKMGRKIRNAYLQAVLRQDIAFFDNVGAGEVAGRTTKDIALIQGGIGEKLAFAIWCFTTIVVGLIVGFIKAARMAGVLLCLIPFTLFLYWVTVHFGNKMTEKELDAEGKAGNFLDQVLGSIRIAQAFSAEKALASRYDEKLAFAENIGGKKAIVRGGEMAVLYYCVLTSFSLSFWWGSELLNTDGTGIGIGPLTTTFFVFLSGLFSVAGIVPQISVIAESSQVQARIFRDIDRTPEINSWSQKGYTGDVGGDVYLDKVTFAYPARPTEKSLDNVSLHFEKNKTTAIVGQSGSGKSTVTSLLLRFYDPASGNVSLGSRNLKDFNVTHLRRSVAMCSQNPTMFNMSVYDNIAAGMTGIDELESLSEAEKDEAVVNAARAADALGFIESLPKGFDTIVGASGAFLSGGQRQRVAIARAIIRNSQVLILDEATSALDSTSENRVYAALEKMRGDRTTIIIAHRISSIKDADKIVVMGSGKVLEQGTHSELLAHEGPYKALVDTTNANNYIPGINDTEDEDKLPSEKPHSRPQRTTRTTTYDSKAASAAMTHGSNMTVETSRQQQEVTERKSTKALTRVPTNIDDNPAGLINPAAYKKDKYSRIMLLHRYAQFSKNLTQWFLLGILGAAILGASFPTAAFLVGNVIDALAEIVAGDASARGDVHRYALYFEIIAIVAAVASFLAGFLLNFASSRLVRKFKRALTTTLLRQEVGYFDDEDHSVGTLTSGVQSHPASVAAASGLVLSQLLISAFNLIGSIVLAYVMSWKLAVVCLAPVILFVFVAYANVVLLERYENEGQGAQDDSASYASDNIGAIREVQALTREADVHDHYANMLEPEDEKRRLRFLAFGTFSFAFSQALVFWISGLTFWWGSHLLSTNQISETAFYSTFEAVIIASFSTGRASSFIPDISRAFHSMKIMCRYLDRLPKFQIVSDSSQDQLYTEKPTRGSEIVFKNVSLRYPSRPDVVVLENFSLQIKAGQHIAFCGHSGGGKTSTLSLLQRYYDPINGSISFDGQDIRKISLEDHRARMSLVSQDAVLYEGTIAWNLSLGVAHAEEISREQMIKACRDANILEFVESLPEGFDTEIGLKGGQLSGGQRQRLCIARALIRDPQILLLDEATSALDATAEKAVQEALDRASQGRTTITIAHRLTTIAGADVIYVVQDGKIVEGGSHLELLERNGKYKELVEAQLA